MLIASLLAIAAQTPVAEADRVQDQPAGVFPRQFVREWLVMPNLDVRGRRPFRPDEVFAQHVLDRAAAPPKEGSALTGELGQEQRWAKATADADGRVEGDIGWAHAAFTSDVERVVIAKLSGAARLYVNGAGFVGDFYQYGFGGVPIPLAKGRNDIYVTAARGGFALELVRAESPIFVVREDVTRPDAIAGTQAGELIGAVGITLFSACTDRLELANASVGYTWLEAQAQSRVPDDPGPFAAREWVRKSVPPLAPAQAHVMLESREDIPSDARSLDSVVQVGALDVPPINVSLSIDVRDPAAARRVTYISHVDDSLQEFALVPAGKPSAKPPRVVLGLHGASVEALNQARAYSTKDEFWILCPTNRRPYGFDWQDWGRATADEAQIQLVSMFERLGLWSGSAMPTTYVTGHSMGGHGTWHVVANDPASYTALAPSAGWCSFDTYGTRPQGELRELWLDADAPSRTLDLIGNLAQIPAYVVHGTVDDNVPADEARTMIEALEAAGAKPASHFEEGAGHWWDGDRAPGADCVDWPGIFDLFRATERRRPSARIDFTCVDPSITASYDWMWILQQQREGRPSRVRTSLGEDGDVLHVTTENVRRALIRRPQVPGWKSATLAIDDTRLDVGSADDIDLLALDGVWRLAPRDDEEKRPSRRGPFKRAFAHSFVFVYATLGTDAEDRESFERARCDLESWWYRANGAPELLADVEYLADRARHATRDVILYGNADTNAAWTKLLPPTCPLNARRGSMRLGEREWQGDGHAAVFVYPMVRTAEGPRDLLVGAFADTGARGARLGYTLNPFTSGVGYPDYAIFGDSVLTRGDGGVLAAGWFDPAWKLDPEQFVRGD
jgi:poly(3-hydroxybutyrate) depolymerase